MFLATLSTTAEMAKLCLALALVQDPDQQAADSEKILQDKLEETSIAECMRANGEEATVEEGIGQLLIESQVVGGGWGQPAPSSKSQAVDGDLEQFESLTTGGGWDQPELQKK